ncbi:MAG: hypothetical protein COX43_00970 [Parcubacteria group bacterium CG23_combo_of_CG06-09_8_20_14_all_35_9]|nr:MAG: hypothetical protein COX43_00970 [Parcubacteria group bacterium CG23_combo_of_CG06-09_8_20_14_all_35_9]
MVEKVEDKKSITHIAGTFLIKADAAFLNGAGLKEGTEDRNTTIPKTYEDGSGGRVPYVSSQAWKRWLRNTLIEETDWKASVIMATGKSEKDTTNKASGELDPVEFPEDDVFGYMQAMKGQGKRRLSTTEYEQEEPSEGTEIGDAKLSAKNDKVKSIMRASPFMASVLTSIRRKGWKGADEAYVHLKEGTSLPYTTEFYNTHLQGVFCLNYSRLGVFWNVGDRIELEEEKVKSYVSEGKIVDASHEPEYAPLLRGATNGKIYRVTDKVKPDRISRAIEVLNALAKMRGGAKQAQFGTDVSPKLIIMAGLNCGNPIFNDLFRENNDGNGIDVKLDALKEVITDYEDRITSPVIIGIRSGYVANEPEVKALIKVGKTSVIVTTPIQAVEKFREYLR